MKTHPSNKDLPEPLRAYLDTIPAVTHEDLDQLRSAAAELDVDPEFQADYLKSLFVEKMLEALEKRGENQTHLAQRWGKSRQYVSKLFREDKRVNFTIETMSTLAHLLGCHLELRVIPTSNATSVPAAGPAQKSVRSREKSRTRQTKAVLAAR
jgi:ribosome-binding protein aMBF1 (putative translation factor)